MKNAIIIGAGGHARVVISILRKSGEYRILGVIDHRDNLNQSEKIMGVPVLGGVVYLDQVKFDSEINFFLAIGSNQERADWYYKIKGLEICMPNLISSDAIIDAEAQIGCANIICARAFIGPEAVLGDNNLVNTGAIVEHEAQLGNHCHVAPGSVMAGRSEISDFCFLGAGAIIKNNTKVAANVCIGAGATVVGNIENTGGIYIGTPAKKVAK